MTRGLNNCGTNEEREMKEVKRYDSYGYDGLSGLMKEHADGDWVRSEEFDALRAENIGMVAQRMAYAGEFPPDQDGLPDTGSIHQNIRKLRAENAELVAALVDAQKIINHQGWSANEQPAYDFIDAALAKPPVKDEPVAWLCTHHDGRTRVEVKGGVYDQDAGWGASRKPLYLHPPAAQASSCSNCERCQESLNALDDLTEAQGKANAELVEILYQRNGECVRLHGEIAELAEALEHILKMQLRGFITLGNEATDKARAALAKHRGEATQPTDKP